MNEKSNAVEIKYWQSLIIGGISGSIAKTLIAPFDRVKIHFQVATPEFQRHTKNIFGIFRAIKDVYVYQGIRGLFQGHSLTLIRIFPYSAVNYSTYEIVRKYMIELYETDFHSLPSYARFSLGSISGLSAVILTYPLDLLRARMAFRFRSNQNFRLWSEVRLYYHSTKHITDIYKGFVPTALGMTIYSGTSFFVYDSLKEHVLTSNLNLMGFENFLCGFSAGLSAQILSYPLDVMRRRMQVFHIARHLQTGPYPAFSMFIHILRTEGPLAFWRGLSINFLKVAPATGISFYCYNLMKSILLKGQ